MHFKYKVLEASGKSLAAEAAADSREQLIRQLGDKGYTILDIQEVTAPPVVAPQQVQLEWFGVADKHVLFFTRQLSSLLEAGISLAQCMRALQTNCPSQKLAAAIAEISADIQRGIDLHEAFARHPKIFNKLFCSMIKVGETTGALAGATKRLADYMDKEAALKRKLRAAMAYPTVILVFSCALVYGMVAYLLPGFTPMFNASGLNLANYPITEFLIAASNVLRSDWFKLLAVPLLVAIVIMARSAMRTERGHALWDHAIYNMPFIGGMVQLSVLSRVTNTLAALTNSGIGMIESFDLLANTAGNDVVARAMQQIRSRVQAGEDLATSFSKSGVFPPLMIQMVAIGEQSADLPGMLTRVSRYYEEELDTALNSISAMIEPLMMIVVGGIVFVFVLGVLLPIMGIVSAVQSSM